MLILTHVTEPHDEPYGVVVLDYAQRQRQSFPVRLKSGEEVRVALPREAAIVPGAFLRSEDGRVVRVVAATETVHRADFANPLELARAAYALGARHTPVQVEDGWLLTLPDATTRRVLEEFGATVRTEHLPFQPERRL
ncbi:MAG: urease accessory protein UreE [Burkholderiales bacterium]